MSLIGRPGLTASIPFHMHSSVMRDEVAALLVDVADEERGVGVAVDTTDVGGDVEVHDVAVLHRPGVGDAVADHLVGRRAQALRVEVVVERARVGAALDVELWQ